MLLHCPALSQTFRFALLVRGSNWACSSSSSCQIFSFSISESRANSVCEVQWQSVAALLQVPCILKTVRDPCRFQCETKMTNMSSDGCEADVGFSSLVLSPTSHSSSLPSCWPGWLWAPDTRHRSKSSA